MGLYTSQASEYRGVIFEQFSSPYFMYKILRILIDGAMGLHKKKVMTMNTKLKWKKK